MEASDGQEITLCALGLTKTFRSGGNDLVVFAGLNLEVVRGERLALVGESGAGKSTLLHILGGLDRPTSGAIYFRANAQRPLPAPPNEAGTRGTQPPAESPFCASSLKEISSLPDRDLADFRNREVGFVWQIHYLLPEFTALENVMMPLLIRGVPREEAEPAAAARLDEVGLRMRAWHRAGELSGGEQQRVVLARALVGKPSLLLADEPTGNLDARTGSMIMDILKDLHQSHGLTSIIVTHNLSFAERCDRVLKLEGGILVPGASSKNGKTYV